MPVTCEPLSRACLPPTRGSRLPGVCMEEASVRLQRRVTAPAAAGPRGAVSSAAVPRRGQRRLTGLAWGTRAGRPPLAGRPGRGRHRAGGRRLCTARRPERVAAWLMAVTPLERPPPSGRAVWRRAGTRGPASPPAYGAPPGHPRRSARSGGRRSRLRQPGRPSASTSGPGGGASALAPSPSGWRRLASWPCCRGAPPPAWRPG